MNLSEVATTDLGEDLPIGLDSAVEAGEAFVAETVIQHDSDFESSDDGIVEVIEDDFF